MATRPYKTIKDVVCDIIRQTKGLVGYETGTKTVLVQFPNCKRPVKQALWDSGIRACQKCGKEKFGTIKGVKIHRKNADEAYSVENCQLLCRKCHRETR